MSLSVVAAGGPVVDPNGLLAAVLPAAVLLVVAGLIVVEARPALRRAPPA